MKLKVVLLALAVIGMVGCALPLQPSYVSGVNNRNFNTLSASPAGGYCPPAAAGAANRSATTGYSTTVNKPRSSSSFTGPQRRSISTPRRSIGVRTGTPRGVLRR